MKIYSNGYIPKVLVAGDPEQFRAPLRTNQAVRVVGAIALVGRINDAPFDLLKDNKLLLNGKLVESTALKNMADQNVFDYIVFLDYLNHLRHAAYLAKRVPLHPSQLITFDFFSRNVDAGFYSYTNDALLFRLLHQLKTRSLLDADSYFAEGQYYIKPEPLRQLSIEALRSATRSFAINDNIYDRVYESLEDCRFRHYDAVLLSAERDVEELRAAIEAMRAQTNEFIVFVRREPTDVRAILVKGYEFDGVGSLNAVNGNWYVLRKTHPTDMSIYVVSHKKHSIEPLPDGYVTIHAGRALGNDLGYLGDDTGDNISTLNPYLNELTALYWVWKNAKQEFVGIAHYRRFFSSKGSKTFDATDILTGTRARELLNQYDMLIGSEAFSEKSQHGLMAFDAEYDAKLAARAINVIKKMLGRYQPDYVDAFEQLMCGQGFMCCNMMITRKYVFDAYCQWLFSFLLPAYEEFKGALTDVTVRRKRILGFVSERMFGVWLLRNRLKLREFSIMVDQ